MAEYIERDKLLDDFELCNKQNPRWTPQRVKSLIVRASAADVVEVVPELRKAVKLLHKEYEKAKQSPIVRDPLAYALYQTWKAVDSTSKNGR